MKPKPAWSRLTAEASWTVEFSGLKAQYARLKPEIDTRIQVVLDHGRFIMGPEVAELETELARFAGCAAAAGVSSGTDAMLIALMAEGIAAGDAVFLPAFTFPATAEVVVAVGAEPVFVDVDPHTFNIDPDDLKRRIAEVTAEGRLRPRAVIAVDLFGLPADYRTLGPLSERHGLFLLADAAQSFGASLDGMRVGRLATVTATSFFPAKPLGCYGDGGALLTDDLERVDVMRSIRAHGRGADKYDIVRPGLNSRLDTLQAAILLAKLPFLPDEIELREQLVRYYDARLGDLVAIPKRREGAQSAWAQYSILVDDRDRVAAELNAQGIPTAVYYPRPIHLQPAYEKFGAGPLSLPVSEGLCRRILSLPLHPYLDAATVEGIANAVAAAVRAK